MRNIYILGLLCSVFLLMSNRAMAPFGRTGAPGEAFCGSCHSGSNPAFDGDVVVSGFPSNISPSTTYPLTVTVNNPNMAAVRAGFQITVLNSADNRIGNLSNNSANSYVATNLGREYFGHAPAQNFSGGSTSWTVDWESPATGGMETFTLYAAGVIANGSGNSGDKAVSNSVSGTFAGAGVPLSMTIQNEVPTLCSDSSDGSAEAVPNGGSGNYTYQWDNGETTRVAVALDEGLHFVTVSDGSSSVDASTIIESPDQLSVDITTIEDVSCFNGNDGAISVEGFGGVGGYSFSWSNGETGASISGLSPGQYTVSLEDANGCEITEVFIFDNPDEILITNENVQNLFCNGDVAGGAISIDVSGGSSGLTAAWSNGEVGTSISNLTVGSYTVSVSDNLGCEVTNTYTITEPQELVLESVVGSTVSCLGASDGTASANAEGGTGTVVYSWSNGDNGSMIDGLAAGTYTVSATDVNGCITTMDAVVEDGPSVAINFFDDMPASCLGVEDGTVSAEADDSNDNYTYQWSNGQVGAVLTNVTAGDYIVTATGALGCLAIDTFSVEALTTATLDVDNVGNVDCFGDLTGSSTVSLINGNGYNIVWSNGTTGPTIQDVGAGEYTAMATDAAGCESNQVMVMIEQPDSFMITAMIDEILCSGGLGIITASASGGTGNINYEWSTGDEGQILASVGEGSYILNIEDANGCTSSETYELTAPSPITTSSESIMNVACFGDSTGMVATSFDGGSGNLSYNWSNGSTDAQLVNVPAGTYTVEVVDTNNCMYLDTFIIGQPAEIVADISVANESVEDANDGILSLQNITGGTGTYTFVWSNGSMDSVLTDLEPGTYSIEITDSNGCVTETSYVVNSAGCSIMGTATTVNVSCSGGSDGQIILDLENVGDVVTITANGESADLNMLPAGNYNIDIEDNSGCTFSIQDVVIGEPEPISVSVTNIVPTSSTTEPDGAITIEVLGGTSGYDFTWENASGEVVSTEQNPTDLPEGTYSVIVTDSNGCSFELDGVVVTLVSSTSAFTFDVAILPNPFVNEIQIQTNGKVESVDLFGIHGQLLLRVAGGESRLNTSDLKSGTYLLSLKFTNGETYQQMIIK